MSMQPSSRPAAECVADLDAALRRLTTELDLAAARRRAHDEHARERWRGRRRDEFERQVGELDAVLRRLTADLRAATGRTTAWLDGGR
jgi:hypothetical protein